MKNFLPLVLVLILASVLRFWNLAGNPPGLTWDEAALGYNSYSLLQTGRDEYGNFFPLNLKSFGDWKPALYAYLDIPFVATLGINELSVRLPSAIFGSLSVLLVYFLVLELFGNRPLAYFSAFFLAISPMHIQFTRPAYEAGVALFLNMLGIYLFVRGLKKKSLLIFSTAIFGLSLLTYQGSRIFVPLLVLSLIIIFRKQIQFTKYFKVSLIVFVIFLIISFAPIIFQGQSSRLSTLNFFAYQRSTEEIQTISKEDGTSQNSFGFQVLHGEWWAYTRGLFERYLIYFSPKMLFVDGDYNQRQRVPDLGALYYFSMVLIPIGVIYFLRLGGNWGTKLLFAWFLLAPIPAVLSRDLISTLRALNLVLPLTILEAAGFWQILDYGKKLGGKRYYLLIIFSSLIIAVNFLIYLDRYFIHSPKEYSQYWLYGYKELYTNLPDLKKYEYVKISDKYGQPYIYYLFYKKYPPADFQKQAILEQPTVDVGTVLKIDNIEFRHIYWPSDRGLKNSLFVGTPDELPDQDILPFKEFKTLGQINFLDGETAFRMVETK